MHMPFSGKANVRTAWSEKVASENETSRVDSMFRSARTGDIMRRSSTVPPPPSGGSRVTTSLSFKIESPWWAIVARRGLAAPREALGAIRADQSGWWRLKSPATIQGVPRGIGKSLRSLSERLVSEGAPLYTEEM